MSDDPGIARRLVAAGLPRCALWMALALAGCATADRDARPISDGPPPPPSSIANALGYDDAVALGASYAQSLGYQTELAEARWTGLDWDLRYRFHEGKELKELQVKVDAMTRQILSSEAHPLSVDAGSAVTR